MVSCNGRKRVNDKKRKFYNKSNTPDTSRASKIVVENGRFKITNQVQGAWSHYTIIDFDEEDISACDQAHAKDCQTLMNNTYVAKTKKDIRAWDVMNSKKMVKSLLDSTTNAKTKNIFEDTPLGQDT